MHLINLVALLVLFPKSDIDIDDVLLAKLFFYSQILSNFLNIDTFKSYFSGTTSIFHDLSLHFLNRQSILNYLKY